MTAGYGKGYLVCFVRAPERYLYANGVRMRQVTSVSSVAECIYQNKRQKDLFGAASPMRERASGQL
jgi:hypothetical protein